MPRLARSPTPTPQRVELLTVPAFTHHSLGPPSQLYFIVACRLFGKTYFALIPSQMLTDRDIEF